MNNLHGQLEWMIFMGSWIALASLPAVFDFVPKLPEITTSGSYQNTPNSSPILSPFQSYQCHTLPNPVFNLYALSSVTALLSAYFRNRVFGLTHNFTLFFPIF